jgi:hypothetical protein
MRRGERLSCWRRCLEQRSLERCWGAIVAGVGQEVVVERAERDKTLERACLADAPPFCGSLLAPQRRIGGCETARLTFDSPRPYPATAGGFSRRACLCSSLCGSPRRRCPGEGGVIGRVSRSLSFNVWTEFRTGMLRHASSPPCQPGAMQKCLRFRSFLPVLQITKEKKKGIFDTGLSGFENSFPRLRPLNLIGVGGLATSTNILDEDRKHPPLIRPS